MLKSFRIFLWPFAFLYRTGVAIRNFCYDKNIFKTSRFGLPIICVGNLSVGGTGKSPMVEYLVHLLQPEYQLATLSRGYKRRTQGYALANDNSTALDIGDEPMQFHVKFPEMAVAVGEKRVEAIPQLLHDKPDTDVIILDDAFQHRAMQAGLNILLTDYQNLFTRDYYLPYGKLRDLKSGYKRADIIVVTKCEKELSAENKQAVTNELQVLSHQKIFFTNIDYGQLYHIISKETIKITPATHIMLITGIANANPLQAMFTKHTKHFRIMKFTDHHIYRIDDFQKIKKTFEAIEAKDKIIITTEKDAVRFIKFKNEIGDLPMYVLPMQHQFLFSEEKAFQDLVTKYVANHLKKN